jgi:hypothetical protein
MGKERSAGTPSRFFFAAAPPHLKSLRRGVSALPSGRMTKPDRLKNLPPAARVAQVCTSDAAPGLEIKLRYVRKPYDGGHSRFVHPGMELWGISL